MRTFRRTMVCLLALWAAWLMGYKIGVSDTLYNEEHSGRY